MRLGGRMIPADVLNRGHEQYEQYCATCHGTRGDGKGPGVGSSPPLPRDFTKGIFKYKSTPGRRGLPTDADLLRSVTRGLGGTRMASWAMLPRRDRYAIVQYLKTFSPRWRRGKPGPSVPVKRDPWAKKSHPDAIARGRRVYHGRTSCWQCHPAYVPRVDLLRLTQAMRTEEGRRRPESILARGQTGKPAWVDTDFGRVLAPDFLGDKLKLIEDKEDLYRAIGAGIGGTEMKPWASTLSARDIWALIYYVRHLIRARGTPAAERIRQAAAD